MGSFLNLKFMTVISTRDDSDTKTLRSLDLPPQTVTSEALSDSRRLAYTWHVFRASGSRVATAKSTRVMLIRRPFDADITQGHRFDPKPCSSVTLLAKKPDFSVTTRSPRCLHGKGARV